MVDRLVNSEANTRRINNVEGCFGISGVPLAIPGRVLVGEGVLTKICRKKPKPRQFFLFNDIMVYGSIILNKKKYNTQHIIPLEQVKLEDLKDDANESQLKNGWLIKTPTKSFAVYAATATEKSEWMAHIDKCVDDLIKKTGKTPTSDHAAVWIPDSEARQCMHCEKTSFSVLNRRHHSRNCGSVVCGNCSKNKFMLPNQATKPLRVCNTCYETLSKSRTSLTNTEISYEADEKSSGNQVEAKRQPSTNESSDSEDDAAIHDTDDDDKDVAQLEDLNIEDEKPTFYNTSFTIEDNEEPAAVVEQPSKGVVQETK